MASLSELQAEKAELKEAIRRTLVAQSYGEGATRVQKANLDILYKRLEDVEAKISILSGYKTRVTPVFKDAK